MAAEGHTRARVTSWLRWLPGLLGNGGVQAEEGATGPRTSPARDLPGRNRSPVSRDQARKQVRRPGCGLSGVSGCAPRSALRVLPRRPPAPSWVVPQHCGSCCLFPPVFWGLSSSLVSQGPSSWRSQPFLLGSLPRMLPALLLVQTPPARRSVASSPLLCAQTCWSRWELLWLHSCSQDLSTTCRPSPSDPLSVFQEMLPSGSPRPTPSAGSGFCFLKILTLSVFVPSVTVHLLSNNRFKVLRSPRPQPRLTQAPRTRGLARAS